MGVAAPAPFDGVVLAGGASRRMGTDKAMVAAPDGRPLVVVAADGLRGAGAAEVTVVGGDADGLAHLGLSFRPDLHPGEGPLGGIVTALLGTDAELVVVVACDMPGFGPEVPAALVGALTAAPDADVAVAVDGGRDQPLTAAWRRSGALGELRRAFDAGERAPRHVLARLSVVRVPGLPSSSLVDVDEPADLRRYAERHPAPATRTGQP